MLKLHLNDKLIVVKHFKNTQFLEDCYISPLPHVAHSIRLHTFSNATYGWEDFLSSWLSISHFLKYFPLYVLSLWLSMA